MKAAEPGDPTAEGAAMGPLSSATAAERLQDQLDRAKAQGAEVVARRRAQGQLLRDDGAAGITPDNDAYSEEFFGPVASVYKVGSEEEAVELANDTPFGLGSYVFATTPSRRCGSPTASTPAWCSSTGSSSTAPSCPFGGVKRSGFGRELGPYGMDEFVNKKLIRVLK